MKRLMFYLWRTRGNIYKTQLTAKFDKLDDPIGGEVMTFVEQLSHEERKKGQEEGIALEKVNMAIKCLKKGADINFIVKVTKLSIEQVNALAKEHKIH